MNNQKAYKIFLERLAKHATTPPPRHFGKSLMKKPLHFEFETLKDFSISKQSGLFVARIIVKSMDEKFMINGLITRITINKGHLRIVYYDTSGHCYLDVKLEHLVDMQKYRPRDGTKFLIENEKLVIKSKNINRQNERKKRVTNSLTTPNIPKMGIPEVTPTSAYPT